MLFRSIEATLLPDFNRPERSRKAKRNPFFIRISATIFNQYIIRFTEKKGKCFYLNCENNIYLPKKLSENFKKGVDKSKSCAKMKVQKKIVYTKCLVPTLIFYGELL